MIYEFIRDGLQSTTTLLGKVFPVSVNIDEVDGSFAVYTFRGSTPVKDLMNEDHHYTDTVDVDFLGYLYDELHDLYRHALKHLTVSNLDTGHGEYIFSSVCSTEEPEQFDPDTGLFRKPMRVTIDWCLMEEE